MEERNKKLTISFSIESEDRLCSYIYNLLQKQEALSIKINSLDILEWAIKENNTVLLRNMALLNSNFIFKATIKNDIETVRKLIEAGADINESRENMHEDGYNRTEYLIGIAVENNYIDMARLLILNGADLNVLHDYSTPIYIAVEKDYVEMAKLLLDSNKVDTKQCNQNLVCMAVENNNLEMLKVLIEKGADITGNERQSRKENLLFLSLKEEHFKIAEFLIENGANVTIFGTDFVRIATEQGNKKIVELLIKKGAKFESSFSVPRDPIVTAIENNDIEIVKLLLKAGARVGEYGMLASIMKDNLEMVSMFIEAGVDSNMQTREGYCELGDYPVYKPISYYAISKEMRELLKAKAK